MSEPKPVHVQTSQQVVADIVTIDGTTVVRSGSDPIVYVAGVPLEGTVQVVPKNPAAAAVALAAHAEHRAEPRWSDVLPPAAWARVFNRDSPQTFSKWAKHGNGPVTIKRIDSKKQRVDLNDLGPDELKRYEIEIGRKKKLK